MNKKARILILSLAAIFIMSLALVYAALSQSLNVNTDIGVTSSSLNVSFVQGSLSASGEDGANVLNAGSINGSKIENIILEISYPGSYVDIEVQAINNTEYFPVKLTDIYFDILGTPTISYNNTAIDFENITQEEMLQFVNDFDGVVTQNFDIGDFVSSLIDEVVSNYYLSVYKVPNNQNDNLILLFATLSSSNFPFYNRAAVLEARGQNNVAERSETYTIKIGMSSNSTLTIPENYSFIFPGIDVEFTYSQVASS